MIRQPIVSILGHVDHGKTTLLDKIRGTSIALSEPGRITQAIGATNVPKEFLEKICKDLLKRFNVEIKIPGILFIDTPGHESFITLRKRGGAVADIGILVVDIQEGFKPQTYESLNFLKEFNVPFLIAATKIDRIKGWNSSKISFLENLKLQQEFSIEILEELISRIVLQLAEIGYDSERFDRIEDFKKKIAIVPCSGISGEGIPELLMVVIGISQIFIKERLFLSEKGKGSILEVKEEKGLGSVANVILYDGSLKEGDTIVIGGKNPIITKVKALYLSKPLKELRAEKNFIRVKKVFASVGVKLLASNLENAISGSSLIVVKNKKEIEEIKKELIKEIEKVEFSKNVEGCVAKSYSLGSLEALIKLLKDNGIEIRKAEVGNINKQDVREILQVKDENKKVIFGFNVKIESDAKNLIKDYGIKVFVNNVIYKILEDYKEWIKLRKEERIKELLEKVQLPAILKMIPGAIFRSSKPAIFGIEVLEGKLKTQSYLKKLSGKPLGKIKEIQKEGKKIKIAEKGEKVAISMDDVVIGRSLKENETLIVDLKDIEIKILKEELWEYLSESEKKVLKEYYDISDILPK